MFNLGYNVGTILAKTPGGMRDVYLLVGALVFVGVALIWSGKVAYDGDRDHAAQFAARDLGISENFTVSRPDDERQLAVKHCANRGASVRRVEFDLGDRKQTELFCCDRHTGCTRVKR